MTEEQLEAELDLLFQRPPAELVKARNALAEHLRKLGHKALYARVKKVARPTPAAWALNRLQMTNPALLEQAQAEADRVRALHAEQQLDSARLRQAMVAQRAAISAVVAAAEALCAAEDVPYGSTHQRKLLATIQGWLAGLSDQRPGRMTHDLEPAGFDAVQVVGEAAMLSPPTERIASVTNIDSAAVKRQAQQAEAQQMLARQQREIEQAREQVRRCQAARNAADASLQDVTRRVQAAQRALEEIEQQKERAQIKLQQLHVELSRAQASETQMAESLNLARSEVEALERTKT